MCAGEQRSYRPLHLDMAEPLLQRAAVMPQQQPNALAENVDILRATEHRVVSLEALLKEKESQLDSARQDVEQLQVEQPCAPASSIQWKHMSAATHNLMTQIMLTDL